MSSIEVGETSGATSIGQIALDLVVNKNKFNSQMTGIQSTAKKVGQTIASAFALKKIVDFSKQCINLRSDLEEVQNVVNVTFPSMTKAVDNFAQGAAEAYGLSETMAKKFSGTYGSMAKAFGFTEEAAFEMGTTLTGLAGDVASFYNLSQDEAYTKLKSVFSGETETLKDLGVVMTQTALDSYALANGYGKTTKAMSEAEKVALRYAFVQDQLSDASGDFERTSDSWSNQTKLLKLNLEQLGTTIGGPLINALKPLLSTVNSLISKFTTFAQTVSDSLGAIFGWTYEDTSSLTDGLSSGADSADNIASGISDASDEASKLKNALRGFDELNVISTSSDSGSSSDTSSDSSSGEDTGNWTKTESIWSNYESDLDSLSKLGEHISNKIKTSLESINWNSVYEKASGFASGLASFLNGLINEDTFAAVGSTLSGALNTAMITVNTFFEEFDFKQLGKSITTGISSFFSNLNWSSLGSVLSGRFKALCDFITGLFNGIDWSEAPKAIGTAIGDFLSGFDWAGAFKSAGELIATALVAAINFLDTLESEFENIANDILDFFVGKIEEAGFEQDKGLLENGAAIVLGLLNGIIEGLLDIGDWLIDNVFGPILDGFLVAFGIKNGASKEMDGIGAALIKGVLNGLVKNVSAIIDWFKNIPNKIKTSVGDLKVTITTKVEDFKAKLKSKWNEAKSWWNSKNALSNVSVTVNSIKEKVRTKWNYAKEWWNSKNSLSNVSVSVDSIKSKVIAKWNTAREWWKKKPALKSVGTTISSIQTKLSDAWNTAREWWKNDKPSLKNISVTVTSIKDKLKKAFEAAVDWAKDNFKLKFQISYSTENLKGIKKTIVDLFGLEGWPTFQFFAKGGFPEDGWFRAKHGEIMGKFDNGNSVVANNMQITEGISSAVYRGNQENNALVRQEIALLQRQNELLAAILEKEVGISADTLFNSVKKSADSYQKRTGNPAFEY